MIFFDPKKVKLQLVNDEFVADGSENMDFSGNHNSAIVKVVSPPIQQLLLLMPTSVSVALPTPRLGLDFSTATVQF